MKKITVNASKTYDILIEPGLLDRTGALSAPVLDGKAAMIVTDDTVGPLYGERLRESLLKQNLRVFEFILPHGEQSKNAANYIALLNAMADNQLSRSDAVFALGGGVVGDLAGFAAATYMRGIRLVQLPTTLLSAVDSSVGGKTAIDLDAGKNLAGAFYQPDLVICDLNLLSTLTPHFFYDGMAEVVKYGVIADKELFAMLRSPVGPRLGEIVARCVSIKRDVVAVDEKETGPRKLLNFGHTVGHAIEKCSGYAITHGYAVAAGMAIVARASAKMGICPAETAREIVGLLRQLGLPVSTEFDAKRLAAAALSDKKRSGDTVTLIVPKELGRCVLSNISTDTLESFIIMGLETEGEMQ